MAKETTTKVDAEVVNAETAGGDLTVSQELNEVAVVFEDDDFFGIETGLENVTADDVSLPRYTMLQALSPQVNKRKDEYIEGAEDGMILNTASGKVVETQRLVFAAYERRLVAWFPRERPCPFTDLPQVTGGGLYKDFGTDPDIEATARRWDENGSLWLDNGAELVVTGTWYCVDPDTLSVGYLAMGKTQFTPSKKMMAGIRDEKIISRQHGIKPAPLFYRIWEMSSKLREHEGNTWNVFQHKAQERIQEHIHGKAILDTVKEVIRTIREGEAAIDMTVGETEGQGGAAKPKGDDAAM